MKPKIKTVKTTLVGKIVPSNREDNGKTGRHIEEELKKDGHTVDTTGPVDLVDYGVEVKSRLVSSKSSFTIANMTLDDIEKTDYKNSIIYQKIQSVLLVLHDNITVQKAITYDLSDSYIQSFIEKAYNDSKEFVVKGETPPAKGYGYFEKNKKDNSFRFRIPHKEVIKLRAMSGNGEHFHKHFKSDDNEHDNQAGC